MPPIAVLASLLLGLGQTPQDPAPGSAQEGQGDRYQVFLLTIDQGDEVWERFGHNAIRIRNRTTGEDLAWNWGLFSFRDEDFLPRLLRGAMLYSMGPAQTGPFLDAYRAARRTVYSNEILLDEDEAAELDRLIRENFEPENRDYVYHYFLDNCSTRVRDVLDAVLGGALFEFYAPSETSMSYRWHARRLVQETPWIDQGLSLFLGSRTDALTTEWDAMFIPMEMMRILEAFERPGGAGPLLGPREVLVETGRPPAPAAPPAFSPWWLAFGLGGAALIFGLGRAAATRRRAPASATLAACVVLWGSFAGLAGCLMVAFWFTDHDFATWNANLLHLNPLALVLAGLVGAGSWRAEWPQGRAGRAAVRFALAIAAVSACAGLLQLVPLIRQGNAEVLAVAIPWNLAVAAALVRVSRGGDARS